MEQVLFFANRSKATILRPAMMHTHYSLTRKDNAIERMKARYSTIPDGWESLDPVDIAYLMRKEEVVDIAWDYMERYASCDLRERFESLERKHDVADSICYAFMYVERRTEAETMEFMKAMESAKRSAKKRRREEIQESKKIKEIPKVGRE